MKVQDKVVVVTGGGGGIGAALCQRFAREGARRVIVADLEESKAHAVAEWIGGDAVRCDVSSESDVRSLVEKTTKQYGGIDLFCSNAGILTLGDETVLDPVWERTWQVNVMAHIYAARALLPDMLKRGEGYLLSTASAAGLLTQVGGAPYAVTKHAAVAFAEWLAITYGNRGIKVSCLCPLGVRTDMLLGCEGALADHLRADSLSAEEVADAVIRGLEEEWFLILPHPQALDFFQRKASDYDRWLGGMRRLQDKMQQVDEAAGRK